MQLDVIGALTMREIITRYGRHNIGFLWLFLEPMLFTLGITALWSFFKFTHASSLPITAFAVTGYSSILLWRNCSNRAVKAIEVNLSLLYHRSVRVFDIFASRAILEIAGATTSCIALTISLSAAGLMSLPSDLFTVLMGWLLLSWFGFGLAMVIGAISERSELVERTWHIITYLLFPISGAAFMVDWWPKPIQDLLLWIPMVHCTEMIRDGYFGSVVPTHYSPTYVALFNLILSLFGLALVRDMGRRVELE